ncbi:sulfite oxidase heme-binding subunit YedZ [uncultured Thiohalocapsa sp.]|uniref:sulfite oxidase heme-binding subunit YedZ n=1 Tax=uncultured Thiohalocapsa sp. TaxID=768990 RepID=UPI0025EBD1E3|nr:protein-methionine-sulfoxide reductase heme-binding subunit MsrQ [uncultured Thiohalocapsa sp.]
MAATRPRVDWLVPTLKPVLFAACLLPLLLLVWRLVDGTIGPNPVEVITHDTGDWALRLLLATLAVTPLRRLTGWRWLVRLRRMLGLFAFCYAMLHFTTYLWLDQFFDWQAILADIAKRPYITVGFAALLLMLPLAVTSTKGWQRRLGARWKQLHRLVYAIGVLAVLHYLWLVKADLLEPAIYAGVLAALLAARMPCGDWWRRCCRRRLVGAGRQDVSAVR